VVCRSVASIRIRQRKDGTGYTSVLYVRQGKQTSTSFNDHAEALRFQDVCNRLGPAEALRIWQAATPSDGHTVESFVATPCATASRFPPTTEDPQR
jgi:hypothetical protein